MSAPSRAGRLRVALFGSPTFALPTLEALERHHRLLLVVAQPDKPAGRGLRTRSPATVLRARELGLPTLQPRRLRGPEVATALAALELDVAVTAAYGKILPQSLLDIPRHGFLNVHASLLPRYRGAAPIQWALIEGSCETGVTIMQTEAGLDSGPIRHALSTPIEPTDDAASLFERLALLGAKALLTALELLATGTLPSVPQNPDEATVAPMLTRDDGRVRWDDSTDVVLNRHRGVLVWPGSWFAHGATDVKVLELAPASGSGSAGTILAIDGGGVTVATGAGAIRLARVQPAGKAAMSARSWANGRHLRVGDRLG